MNAHDFLDALEAAINSVLPESSWVGANHDFEATLGGEHHLFQRQVPVAASEMWTIRIAALSPIRSARNHLVVDPDAESFRGNSVQPTRDGLCEFEHVHIPSIPREHLACATVPAVDGAVGL